MEPIIKNTWAEGLNPTYQKMSEIQSRMFLAATMTEMGDSEAHSTLNLEESDALFLSAIVQKRIDVMKLPIKFSGMALVGLNSLVDRPGSAVVLLIDCLNAFEGQTVTMSKLASLYPWGFYDKPTMIRYIDDYMKPRKCKWAEIY
jgi:hypothetical protein